MADTSIELHSPADITSRSKYQAVVDPAANPFKRIIRHYWLRIPIQCSIKSCRQAHNQGFLVELLNGDETNIGHVCGRKYFGESFSKDLENYQREILLPELRRKVVLSKEHVRLLLPRVRQLCKEEETGTGKQKRNFRRLFPHLSKLLSLRLARGQATVTRPRKRSAQEVEQLAAMSPGTPRAQFEFEEVLVGQIRGLQSFDVSLHELLHKELLGRMEALLNDDVSALSLDQLLNTELWLRTVDEMVVRAERILLDTTDFFSQANVEILRQLDMPDDEKRRLKFSKLQELGAGDPRDIVHEIAEKPLNRRERRRQQFK